MTDIQNTAPVTVAKLAKHVDLTWYAAILKAWLPRESGPKVTSEQLAMAHLLWPKKRAGVEALHIAMALREHGCTVRQFQIAGSCGPANNHRRAMVASKVVRETVVGKPYAYVLTVTPKGEAAIAKFKHQEGYGSPWKLIPSFVKEGINRIKNIVYGRTNPPPGVKRLLDQYGNKIIVQMEVGRSPIMPVIKHLLDIVSGGTVSANQKKLNYDEIYHLYIYAVSPILIFSYDSQCNSFW